MEGRLEDPMKNEFITGDSLQTMLNLPNESVHVVLTDPPYPNYQGLFLDDVADGYAGLYLSSRKAKNFVIFFWSPRFPSPTPPPGWWEISQHVWHKPDAKANTRYEHIIVWSRERQRKTSRVFTVPILDYRTLADWQPHPSQKPLRLIRILLDMYTTEGDTVLDPFAGSGTTPLACAQLKRNCIAIEKNKEYADAAKKRLEQRPLHAYNEPTPPNQDTPSEQETKRKPAAKK